MNRIFYLICAICTAAIGYHIHGSVFWAVVDFFFMPFAWLKWFIFHEVNFTIIQEALSWFVK